MRPGEAGVVRQSFSHGRSKTVIAEKKVTRRQIAPGQCAAAEAAGKPAITVVPAESTVDARVQLKQGRIDAAVQGSETLPYVMEQEAKAYATVGGPIATQLTGIAVPVKETGLQAAIAGALDALIADGTYAALLAKWHLSGNGIEKATVNAGR